MSETAPEEPDRDGNSVLPAQGHSDESTTPAVVVYALYLGALVSGITLLIGVVVAYVNRGKSSGWLESHFRFQVRTFWIFLLGCLVGALLAIVIIGWLLLLFLWVWLIVRCVKGIQAVSRNEPYPNPETWLW
ncbi:DUF4870 family protein [Algihabitans albus]|uniref:DUF4870 family protein n=1 Tax=Algihabitans albus TaxID=2164067 RepID=UPI001ABC88A3|nr:DUF4870 domain-containing protein [Algihabitans albus]